MFHRLNQKWIQLKLMLALFLVLVDVPQVAQAGHCGACGEEPATVLACSGCRLESYCDKSCQESHWKTHKPFCKAYRPYKDLAGSVEIRPSEMEGAGSGLFAKKAFHVGELVAVYTGKAITTQTEDMIQHGASAYLQSLGKGDQLIDGDPNPIAPHLGAQIANDPLITAEDFHVLLNFNCKDLSPENLHFFNRFTKKYLQGQVEENYNVNLYPAVYGPETLPAFKVTREIAAGEEIRYPYGLNYWIAIPAEICHRKGQPRAAATIRRHSAIAMEEILETEKDPSLLARFKKAINELGTPLTAERYAEKLRSMDEYPFEFSLMDLVAPPGTLGVTALRNHKNHELFQSMKRDVIEHLQIAERIEAISELPNAEFFDHRSFGKVHPESKKIFQDMVECLRREDAGGSPWMPPWFINSRTEKPMAWDDLLRLILGA